MQDKKSKAGRPRKTETKKNVGYRMSSAALGYVTREAKRNKQTVSTFIDTHFANEPKRKQLEAKLDEILDILKEMKSSGKF